MERATFTPVLKTCCAIGAPKSSLTEIWAGCSLVWDRLEAMGKDKTCMQETRKSLKKRGLSYTPHGGRAAVLNRHVSRQLTPTHPACLKAQLLHDLGRSELDLVSSTLSYFPWRKKRHFEGGHAVSSILGQPGTSKLFAFLSIASLNSHDTHRDNDFSVSARRAKKLAGTP